MIIKSILLVAALLVPPIAVTSSLTDTTERGFTIHTRESAPESTRKVFDAYNEIFGFVPNLGAIMAESPALLNSYWSLQMNLQSSAHLTQAETNVVQMAIAVENECRYCTAGHTMAGKMFFKTPDDVIAALRNGAELPDIKLEVLRSFALAVYEGKGRVTDDQFETFLKVGYTRGHALDVIACVSAKVMTNFTNQLAKTPLDEPLKPLAEGLPFSDK